MDRISTALLDEFSRDTGISHEPEDTRFEAFATYLAVSRHYPESFNSVELLVGSGGDTGIDAIATLVNGVLVDDPEAVADLVEQNGYLDATFVFVQAERSPSFATKKIGQFGYGVEDFFKETPTIPRNANVAAAAEVMGAVYQRSARFKRGNPSCRLYYVTTGKWTGDQALDARRRAVIDDLRALGIFSDVDFSPVDAAAIQKLYGETKNAVARDFTFASRTVLPEIAGVTEAYLGLLPAQEFISLLDDGNGNILKTVFYDNVRDWQDYNPVNAEMRTTIESSARARFALMNNGITLIAKTLRATGNRFHIEDYQIVNGCQTSHVLFENRQHLDDSVMVPLRVVATTDEEVTAAIVKATNRQTAVKEEQLIALSDFQKSLEAYFETFDAPQRLYYERRSHQFASVNLEKTRIVTPASLIRAYAAMFLEEPHRTTRNYSALVALLGSTIFGSDHQLEPYYLAASASYRLEYLFRNALLGAKYKPARYHILMAVRLITNPNRPPAPNARETNSYCKPLAEAVWDAKASQTWFTQAASLVEASASGNFDRDHIRTQPFTQELKARCTAFLADSKLSPMA